MIDIHKGQTEDQESAAKPAEPSVFIGDDDGASKPLPEEPQSLAEHLESAPQACSDETSADPERPPSDVIPDEPEPSDPDEAPAEPEPTASRRDWRSWLSSGWAKFVYFLALVSAVVTIVAYVEGKLGDSAISIPEIRVQLVESVEATYRRQKEAAEAIVGDWQERERQLEAALKQRDAQLQRIHALAEEFQRIASGADADTIASKLTRILQEQGPSQALDYIETQREDIVARFLADRAANLAKLEPLLASAGLYASEGEAEQARGLYAQIVELAPDWPEALDAHWGFLIDQGDLAMIRGTLDAAERDFALARQRVETLIALQPEEPRWQGNLGLCFDRIGDVKVARGDLDGAQQDYEGSLAIAKRLAADEPGNAGWQRDLSVSLNKLGDVKVARGDLDGAQQDYEGSLAIRERLAADEPGNAGWQRDLSVSLEKLGDVKVARGDLDGAQQDYEGSLAIRERLAADEPGNAGWQRELSVSLIKLGDVKVARGDLDGAQQDYEGSLAILERLAADEPGNAGWQRDLSVGLNKLGDVKVARGDLDGAQQDYEGTHAILERLAADEPGNAGWQRDLSVSLNKLGDVKVARGDLDGAQQDYEGSLAIMVRQAADEPGNAGWQRDLAVSHYKLGTVADARGDQRALAQHWSAMLAIFDALDQAGMHISPSDRAGLPAIRARVEAISTATPARNTPAMSPGAD
ncbi:MAG: tetratricopeptide repeat protein [Thiohalocapsa sp. PB-PSB1]|jgi:tetratricopeptide (TPR) repeat protein|nr:MAG: tetratricopeptide repeat protein [Thiohalocapsa sp. PB-PSB1]